MNTYKILVSTFFLFLLNSFSAQITFDMQLSETSSKYKIIAQNDSSPLPDSITVKGFISEHKKGICGDVCAGGTIKLELSEKVEGYPHSYMYIVTGCTTGAANKEIISLQVTHYTGKETECHYKDVVEIIDSKGVPYYKISIEETKKVTSK